MYEEYSEFTEKELEMYELQKKLWDILTPYTETSKDVMMSTAILMKTAIQMYTVVMTDEDIQRMLSGYICDSIPEMRAAFERQLHTQVH